MLELINVSKKFADKKVFENLNLKISANDFITIIGSNGAGKSTLLNIISGKVRADNGRIILGDEDITCLKPHIRAKKMHRVYQDPLSGTSPSLSIIENLAIVSAKNHGFGLKFTVNRKMVDYYIALLKEVNLGLEEQLNTKVGLLSGGQKQALSLLMATLAKPEVLLLDEHTAALDPETSQVILHLTEKLVKETAIPTLMVTHNLSDAIKYGNRLIMLDKGNILLDISGTDKMNLTQDDLLTLFKKAKGEISSETFFS